MIRIIAFIVIVMLTGQAHAIRIKIATISPEGSVWMEKMRQDKILSRGCNGG